MPSVVSDDLPVSQAGGLCRVSCLMVPCVPGVWFVPSVVSDGPPVSRVCGLCRVSCLMVPCVLAEGCAVDSGGEHDQDVAAGPRRATQRVEQKLGGRREEVGSRVLNWRARRKLILSFSIIGMP